VSSLQLLEFFAARRDAGAPLVLVTVTDTEGSTYSKPGHRILIAADGQYHGLVSGGCLEGDLVEHARRIFVDGQPRTLHYALSGDHDDVWGFGVGCDGSIGLLLQRLDAANAWHPFAAVAAELRGTHAAELLLVTASEHPRLPPGTTWVEPAVGAASAPAGAAAEDAAKLRALAATAAPATTGAHFSGAVDGHSVSGWRETITPLPRILVLGAGPDSVSVVAAFQALGWPVTVGDHRPGYLARPGFERADPQLIVDEAAARALVAARPWAAAIVMSHHLVADQRYLQALAGADLRYVGLLGPRRRRQRLLEGLPAEQVQRLMPRLHAPIGLDIGADSPASIALAIVAEVHAVLRRLPAAGTLS
jgi:xanthine/CO dehydrogenase XdhC/CoxF family maturation factor